MEGFAAVLSRWKPAALWVLSVLVTAVVLNRAAPYSALQPSHCAAPVLTLTRPPALLDRAIVLILAEGVSADLCGSLETALHSGLVVHVIGLGMPHGTHFRVKTTTI